MNDSLEKNFCNILNAYGPELRNALDAHFRANRLSEPQPEDYRLMDRTIETIQMMTRNPDLDYEKLKLDLYAEMLDEKMQVDDRGRAIISFIVGWLKCLLEK
jgi:hypothetical protein